MPLNLSRSLLTIILPGIVATAPWLLLLITDVPALQHWYASHAVPVHVAAFAIAVTAGALFEGVGSYIECLWDRAMASGNVPVVAPDSDQYSPIYHVVPAAKPPGDISLGGKPFNLLPASTFVLMQ